jgi:anti-sigma regulatory factor (Ser/Thr protein kinase)
VLDRLSAALGRADHGVVVCDLARLEVPGADWLLTVFPAALRRAGGWPTVSLHLFVPAEGLSRRLRTMGIPRFLPVHATWTGALTDATCDVAPTRFAVRLDADRASPRRARRIVAEQWSTLNSPTEPFDPSAVFIIVNELAANAVRHGGRPFTVAVSASPSRLLVAVTDPSPAEPALVIGRTMVRGGVGLQLVDELSHEWGTRLVYPRGKTVWASLLPPVQRSTSCP